MKANELRLGNWVQKHGEQYQCGSATIMMLEREESDVKPIPLTEEWLLRLGFDNDDVNRFYKDGIYILFYNVGCSILHNQLHVNIFYVHQLQNLYFALTGEELTLKAE